MHRRSGLVLSHEQSLRYDAGLVAPVLMSGLDMDIGRCLWPSWLCIEAVRGSEQ